LSARSVTAGFGAEYNRLLTRAARNGAATVKERLPRIARNLAVRELAFLIPLAVRRRSKKALEFGIQIASDCECLCVPVGCQKA
jgi:hypothetical protein